VQAGSLLGFCGEGPGRPCVLGFAKSAGAQEASWDERTAGNPMLRPLAERNSAPPAWARCWAGPLTRRGGLFLRVFFFFFCFFWFYYFLLVFRFLFFFNYFFLQF
jgi:hypothetical protein